MREAYRLQKNNLTESLKNSSKFFAVFFIYTGNLIPEYDDVTDKMQNAIKRLNKIVDEAIAAHT